MKLPKSLLIALILLGCLIALLLISFWINKPSYYTAWMNKISYAETRWQLSNIRSYELIGQADWGWHQHTFQISVVNGRIVNSKCELGYDEPYDASWCSTQFDASTHLVPALFNKARDLLETGNQMCPQEDYFQVEFDRSNGVPTRISFDCPDVSDEQEEWQITFTPTTP
jgi:Family of unknown function (DUF6174)